MKNEHISEAPSYTLHYKRDTVLTVFCYVNIAHVMLSYLEKELNHCKQKHTTNPVYIIYNCELVTSVTSF